jgi:hypothetical protein
MMTRSLILASACLFVVAGQLSGATLAPNDPSISAGLKVWLTDPANRYTAATGVWLDASGNSNDTAIVGPVGTYEAPSLSTATPSAGLFNGQTIDIVDSTIGDETLPDLITTPSVNGGTGFSKLTLISLFDYEDAPEKNRPLGIGSNRGGTTAPNLAQAADDTIRRDDGFVDGSVSPPLHFFIRATVLDGNGTDNAPMKDIYFDDSGSGFTMTYNIGSSSAWGSYAKVATGNDVLHIGDLHNTDADAGAVAQVALYSTALTDDEIEHVAEWMAANPNGIPEPSTFVLAALGLLGLAFRGRRER